MPNFICSNRIMLSKTLFDKCIAAFKNKASQGPGAYVTTYMPVKITVDTRLQIYSLWDKKVSVPKPGLYILEQAALHLHS